MTVSQQEIKNRLENFQTTIRRSNLPVTPQKYEIFRIIASSCSHPQVNDIYLEAKNKFPSISLATVYKNLIQFKELNLISEIPINKDSSCYDAKLDIHGHAVDTDSGQVYDLEINTDWKIPEKIKGKKVKKVNLICYL